MPPVLSVEPVCGFNTSASEWADENTRLARNLLAHGGTGLRAAADAGTVTSPEAHRAHAAYVRTRKALQGRHEPDSHRNSATQGIADCPPDRVRSQSGQQDAAQEVTTWEQAHSPPRQCPRLKAKAPLMPARCFATIPSRASSSV